MGMTVTKIFEICYAHQLPDYKGACQNLHGHTAQVELTFRRPKAAQPYPGMIIDFKLLKSDLEPLVKRFDHVFLNNVLGSLGLEPPTVENLCWGMVETILREFTYGDCLTRVRIWESPTSYVEWTHGDPDFPLFP